MSQPYCLTVKGGDDLVWQSSCGKDLFIEAILDVGQSNHLVGSHDTAIRYWL